MTLAPRDYIAERRRDISQRMEALKAELKQLDLMESALAEGPLMVPHPDLKAPALPPPAEARPRRRIEGGIKALVMAILVPLPGGGGMSAQEILISMQILFGVEIPRTSLSPQLSRLAKDKLITVEKSVWRATEKGRNAYPMIP